jgi:hypothetical protein
MEERRTAGCLLFILVRALNPDEGLDVDHVAGPQVAQVAADLRGEFEQARILIIIIDIGLFYCSWCCIIFKRENV